MDIKKNLLPHLYAVIIFLVISYVYFYPLLEGKRLQMSDIISHKGAAKEIQDFREQTGKEAYWTNRLFSGMPAYLIDVHDNSNLLTFINRVLQIGPRPGSYLFILLLGFYITLLAFNVNKWLSIAGAIAYAFGSYFFIIMEAGHMTKTVALAYMPMIIAGVYLAFNKKIVLGALLTAIILTVQIKVNHPQITYYTGIVVLVMGIFEFIVALKQKKLLAFFKVFAVLVLAVVLAFASNFSRLWSVYEYGKYSMRGGSELKQAEEEKKDGGLDYDYATAWSYGIGETLTLLIPNAKGGSSHGELSTNSKVFEALKQNNVPNAKKIIKQLPLYFGSQPFTSGPVYIGAIALFLFVLGIFLLEGKTRNWLIVLTVLSIVLSWGKNFNFITELFFNYFPGYNKFRTVSMTLVIANFTVPLMAVLALNKVFFGDLEKKKFMKSLKYSLYIIGGLSLLILIVPSILGDFTSENDTRMGWPEFLVNALRDDRQSIARMDAFRSLVFILLAAGLMLAFYYKKIKLKTAILLSGLLFLVDMWPVGKRFLNSEDFITKKQYDNPFKPTKADEFILADKELNFRVLNLAVNTFNDASTSYFHNSVGGYHGAKLQRYQDIIDRHISQRNMNVLNMLNTKYFIVSSKEMGPIPQRNPNVLGAAWLVDSVRFVANADEEINALTNFNPASIAFVDEQFKSLIPASVFPKDTASAIFLVDYKPNHLTYRFNSSSEQVAIFSEIYYPEGWIARIDGAESDYFRANYVLRGLVIPAGEHTVEFEFRPACYYTGSKVAYAGSAILILLSLSALVVEIIKMRKSETN